jgi:hypothetical protein
MPTGDGLQGRGNSWHGFGHWPGSCWWCKRSSRARVTAPKGSASDTGHWPGDHHRHLLAKHHELKALAHATGAAIEALNLRITRTPRQFVAYALRHGLGDLNAPPPVAE